jgi:hypothetical protein
MKRKRSKFVIVYDITEIFPVHVCEEIFANLPVKELLEATMVSTRWNEIISSSKQCMKKIRLAPKRRMMTSLLDSQKLIAAISLEVSPDE